MAQSQATPANRSAGGLIRGSFLLVCHPNVWDMAYCDASMFWGPDNWRAIVRDMHEIGMDTLIWSNSAFWGRPLFPGYEARVGRCLRTGCEDPLGVVADEADRLGMKVFYGLGLMGRVSQVRDYAGMEKPWPETWFVWNTALAAALVERYGTRRSFAGLYIAYEMDFVEHEVELYERLIGRHLRPVIGRTKVLASPGNLDVPTRDMARFLRDVKRTSIDILAPQDYGGRAGVETGVENAKANARALERAARPLADMGVTLWSNCETFRLDGTPDGRSVCMPGPIERIRRQIEIQSPLVEKLICWIYQGVMNRRTDLVDVGHPSTQKLYDDYVACLKAR